MKILVLDNYDSFTYNLVHILKQLPEVELSVIRNDKLTIEDVAEYDKVLLSPGPGIPSEAGIMMELIKTYANKKPILGVCLGHQGIAEVFGAKLHNLTHVMHGVATKTFIINPEEQLFKNIPTEFKSGRYHSWIVDTKDLPESIEITATDDQGYIMALKHKHLNIKGVQFHPESILTEHGFQLIKNWVELC